MSQSIIKNATIVIGVEQGKTNFALPTLEPIIREREREVDLIQEAIDLQEEYEAQQRKVEEQQRATTTAAIEQAQQIGEGAISMARGFALLGVSSEDNLRAVIEQLAKIQAAFDIFRGGTNIIKALTAAEGGLAAVKAKLTTITIANTAATIQNTAARTAALAVANPYAAALAALAATLAAVVAAEEDAVDIAREALGLSQDRLRDLEQRLSLERDLAELQGQDLAQKDLELAREKTKAINEQVRALEKQRNAARIEADRLSTSNVTNTITFGTFGTSGEEEDQAVVDLNLRLRELRAQAVRSKVEEKRVTEQIAEAEKEAAEKKQQALDKQIDKERRLAQETMKRREEQQRITEQMQRQAEQAEEQLRNQQAAVGRLGTVERARLENTIRRREAGEDLSRDDLDFLGGLGGGFARFSRDQFAERGQDANQLLGRLGVTASGNTVDEQLATVKEAGNKLRDGVQDVFDNVNIALERMSDKLEDTVRRIARTEDQAVQGAD